ncbi:hypothetical protein ACSQ67_001834 [Phaseolus vulgaris]
MKRSCGKYSNDISARDSDKVDTMLDWMKRFSEFEARNVHGEPSYTRDKKCQEQNSVHIYLEEQVLDQCIRMDKVKRLASENGVVIFTKSSCCLCYAVNILFEELGVKPQLHEIDHDPEGREMEKALLRLGCNAPVPAVFIGGS